MGIERGAALVCAATVALAGEVEASPWNRPQGDLLTISRLTYQEASAEGRVFEQLTSETYLEFGLSDRLMAGGKLGYAWQGVVDPDLARGEDGLDGISDAEGYLQVQAGRWERGALAFALEGAAPASTTSRQIEGRAFERDGSLGASALVGYDFGPFFGAMRMGPRFSLGEDADVMKLEGTLAHAFGDGPLRGGMISLEGFATQSLGGASPEGVDYSLYQVAPSVVLPVWRTIRLQLGGIVDVAGEGLDLGAGGFVALWVGQ